MINPKSILYILSVVICTALIVACGIGHPARNFDLRQMMLGFGFRAFKADVVESLKARGYSLDSTRSSIKVKDVIIYGRKANATLGFKIDQLRSISFSIPPGAPNSSQFIDSLFSDVTIAIGKSTSLTGEAPRGSGFGYIADWFTPKDTCGFRLANIKDLRDFTIYASGKNIKDMFDSAYNEMNEYIRKNPDYRRELERRVR